MRRRRDHGDVSQGSLHILRPVWLRVRTLESAGVLTRTAVIKPPRSLHFTHLQTGLAPRKDPGESSLQLQR